MFNISAALLTRLSTLIALKALPDEAALHAYMRKAFKGVAFLIIGSVLLGATISAALYVVYDQMLTYGYPRTETLAITMGSAVLLVIIFYAFASKWLSERFGERRKKNIIDEKLDFIKDITCRSFEGFIEGMLTNYKTTQPKNKKRR